MLGSMKAWTMPVLLWTLWSAGTCAAHADPSRQLAHQPRFVQAGRTIDADLARNPSDPGALAGRVDLLLARGQATALDDALMLAQRCIDAHPDNSLCAEALGHALAAQARDGGFFTLLRTARASRDAFERALRHDPSNYRARIALLHFYLGTPFFLGGSPRRASELGSEAQRTDPHLTRLIRAFCALDEGKLADAEQYIMAADLSEYVLVQDSEHDLLLALASAHFEAGRMSDSARLYEELSRRAPASEQGSYGLALVARAQGKLDEAAMHLARAVSIAPRPHVYRLLGEIHEARRDRVRAIAAYRAALAARPPLARRDQRRVSEQLASLQR